MSKTDTDATPAAPAATIRRRSPLAEDKGSGERDEPFAGGVPNTEDVDVAGSAEADASEPVFLSQTVTRMGRRRTRVLALLALLLAIGATVAIVNAFLEPESDSPIEQATGGAWSAVTTLSDGLRALDPDGDPSSLRDEARAARKEVQAAGARMKTLKLPVSQTPLRSRVVRALRADDAWIAAVGSTLANPRSPRRGDLATLAKRAAVRTALIADDVAGAKDSVGGTGRLLSATRRGG